MWSLFHSLLGRQGLDQKLSSTWWVQLTCFLGFETTVGNTPRGRTLLGTQAIMSKNTAVGSRGFAREILLPFAVHLKERLVVSQSVRQSVGQAGKQTETHSLGFSVADSATSSRGPGRTVHAQVVRQLTANSKVGGSIPSEKIRASSNPSEHKLLTPPPPPHPPTPKCDIQFQGIEASESRNPLGDRFIGQNCKFLQGVGHPISCLGVCYANEPPKGGMVYVARACA